MDSATDELSVESRTTSRAMSGTFYEAVQCLRPRPRIRPYTAPASDTCTRHTTVLETDPCYGLPGGSTGQSESPHLYSSWEQYAAATHRALRPLNTNDSHPPGSMSPTSSPLSTRSMLGREKGTRNSPLRRISATPGGDGHGIFCRAKSVVKTFRRGSKGAVEDNSLYSGFHSNGSREPEASIPGEVAPQIEPLRPVSKFLPDLTIMVPGREVGYSFKFEHNRVEDEHIRREIDVGALCPILSHAMLATKPESTIEASVRTAGETSSIYTPAAKADDDVFTNSNNASQIERPMTSFMVKLLDARESDSRYKSPSTTSSIMPPINSPTLSRKLRRTALIPTQGMYTGSLRVQYLKAEPASPVLSKPKMWQFDDNEATRHLHVTPSLDKCLYLDKLEVFEENAIADIAPIVHAEPAIIDIRRSEALKQLVSRDQNISAQELSAAGGPTHAGKPAVGPAYDVLTMTPEVLHPIVFAAAYGDVECAELASGMYNMLIDSGSSTMDCKWDGRKQHLLLQSRLMEELTVLMEYGFMCDDLYAAIRNQVFPTHDIVMLNHADFTTFIRRAVSEDKLAEERADKILELAFREEDEGFMQTSPEEEVSFQRGRFDSLRFVYDVDSSDEYYEQLGSPPSTVGTSERSGLEPELPSKWRSSLLSKITQIFRYSRRTWM